MVKRYACLVSPLFYFMLTALFTFPLILHLPTYVADFGDPLLNTWALAWGQHVLLHPWYSINSLFSANAFYPYPHSLAFSEHLLLYAGGTPATGFEALRPATIPFIIEGVTARTLSYEDMLDHIYRYAANIFNPLRLISIADMVSLAEGCANEIDWPRVNPRVLNALALCHRLTPLSEELFKVAPLNIDHPPKGIGQEFEGWPRYALAAQKHKGYFGILRDSFFPAEWWLRFYYGLSPGPAVWWGRLVRHPLHILGWVGHYLRHRVKN